MKFRRDAPLILAGAAVIVTLFAAFVSNRLFGGLTDAVEQGEFDAMEAVVAFNLDWAEKRALSRAEMIAGLPATRRMLASRDRAGLVAEYLEMFEVQRDKHGIDQMQFHLPPATSFLRLHALGSHDDDLSSTRPMVVSTNRDHVTSTGAEIGFTGPALFGTAPVVDPAGEYVGSFEVGLAFGPFLDSLGVGHGLELALFLDEAQLHPDGLPKELFADDNRLGKYLKYHATHWDLLQELVTAADFAHVEHPVRYSREALGVPYGVVLVPLRGSTGTSLGVIVVAKNFGSSRAAATETVVWQGLLALFTVVALAGAIQVVVRGFLVRPLEAIAGRFAKLADGEPDKPIGEAEILCTELQLLAAQHERLRVQADARRATARDEGGAS